MKNNISPVSNLTIFLVIFLLIPLNESCRKTELDPIPYVYVNFYINLSDPIFFDLNAVGNHVLVDATTNNLGISAAGYDGNGIIVYRSQLDEFIAYDRTCPHDFALNGTSVAVEVGSGEIFAICPTCTTNFALPSFGDPSSGPSRYPLKVYRTSFDGQFVHIYN